MTCKISSLSKTLCNEKQNLKDYEQKMTTKINVYMHFALVDRQSE